MQNKINKYHIHSNKQPGRQDQCWIYHRASWAWPRAWDPGGPKSWQKKKKKRNRKRNKAVLEPQVSPAFAITYFCNHCNIRFENTSKYVDTLTLFPKTWTKGHWPLDDLWPHVCWGHMCDSTQGSLCPSPMTIHQCMWIQLPISQNTTYILQTYSVHTMYRMSDHIGSYWTQFRRDKKKRGGGKKETSMYYCISLSCNVCWFKGILTDFI